MNKIFTDISTPMWVLEEEKLKNNLELLKYIKEKTGIKILLALKGFAFWNSFNLINKYLDGCCASGLYEATLSNEEFKRETHTYSPAFSEKDIIEISQISNHIIFNSIYQLNKFEKIVKNIDKNISLGLRVNLEYSISPVEKYSPSLKFSRLGVTKINFDKNVISQIDGLHFHSLCEASAEDFNNVLTIFEEKFGIFLDNLKWVNFGGGHHITDKNYNVKKFIKVINNFKKKYPKLKIYIELGESIGLNTGFLIATILDIIYNEADIVILDISTEAHLPDTIIMPYKVDIRDSSNENIYQYNYKITGNSCLANDILGDYSFQKPLKIGDKIIIEDQMHYTMVKSTNFNGIKLPNISMLNKNKQLKIIKKFNYLDFKNRLS